MKKIWNASARIITAIVITNLLIIAMVGILIGLGRFDDLQTDFIFMHVMYTVVGVINTLLIFLLFYKVDHQNPWFMGFHLRKKDTLFSIVALILSFSTVLIFIWFLDYMEVVIAQYHFEKIFTGGFYKLLGISCIGWFFAALKEEVLARGYFMANLSRLSIPNAIFISALLFMALHFVMGDLDPYKAASWFTGGIVYAYIYVKSGSLTVSTIVHAAHNLVNDLVIHGSQGALVLLNTTVTTADKLIYELVLGTLLLLLTYLFYGKNGVFTPSQNLKLLTEGGQ
ncbi:CPBP family intramembrane glutamic endopeptidase [Bacillus sp. DJP31]|uniref:CPBP family intramembrane glutamic endopeptidase n=1 Tax=Bacillus sp. DJP31 TaxID=3409789 RepID=UPI003BB6FE16